MSGEEMGRIGAGFVSGLDFIQVFEFFEAVLVDGADGFG